MNDREFNSIVEEALALDTEHRTALMDALAESIEQEEQFLDEKLDELDRRWQSIESGEAKTVSIEEAITHARSKIAR